MVKRSYIISIIIAISIIAMSILFIFGDKAIQIYGDNEAPRVGPYATNNEKPSTTGGGSSTATEIENDTTIEETNCRLQQIQYSLKKFVNEVKCTNTGDDECIKLLANCSVDVYNLDQENNGNFGIRYAIIDSNGIELDSKLIQKNVVFGQPELFSASFIQSDMDGVDENLNCSFTMQAVPMKNVCR